LDAPTNLLDYARELRFKSVQLRGRSRRLRAELARQRELDVRSRLRGEGTRQTKNGG